jgi:hypothetical protein
VKSSGVRQQVGLPNVAAYPCIRFCKIFMSSSAMDICGDFSSSLWRWHTLKSDMKPVYLGTWPITSSWLLSRPKTQGQAHTRAERTRYRLGGCSYHHVMDWSDTENRQRGLN